MQRLRPMSIIEVDVANRVGNPEQHPRPEAFSHPRPVERRCRGGDPRSSRIAVRRKRARVRDDRSSRSAEARQIAQQIEANGERISVLDEQYNGAVLRIAELTKGIDQARQRLAVAKRNTNGLRTQVRSPRRRCTWARGRERCSPSSTRRTRVRSRVERATRRPRRRATARCSPVFALRAQTLDASTRPRRRARRAQQERTRLDNTRIEIAAANVRARELPNTNSEIADLVRQEQEARRRPPKPPPERRAPAGRRCAASSRVAETSASATRRRPPTFRLQRVRPGSQCKRPRPSLNKPYRYAATGPDYFDCSGLTMYAWGKAGVSMSHFAASQYSEFPHVPISQLAARRPRVLRKPDPSRRHVRGQRPDDRGTAHRCVRAAQQHLSERLRRGISTLSSTEPLRLTRFSHGAGCGCKLSPADLRTVLGLVRGLDARDRSRTSRRARHRRRRRGLPPPRRPRRRRHHRLLHADRRRPLRLGPHRRHQRALRRVRDGRHAARSRSTSSAGPARASPFELLARVLDGGADVARAAGCARRGRPLDRRRRAEVRPRGRRHRATPTRVLHERAARGPATRSCSPSRSGSA